MVDAHHASFSIPADHPALAGHFPGSPVVPGVVVLDFVLQATERWQRALLHVVGLRQVKFHSPLLPTERADVSIELAADALTFRVMRGDTLIAQGAFLIEQAAVRA